MNRDKQEIKLLTRNETIGQGCFQAWIAMQKPASAMDFYELGLGDFFTLSAQNNRSVGDMLDGVMEKLPEEDFTNNKVKDCVNLAIIGMPNVGKSSLMNGLLQEEKSIVSSFPKIFLFP